MMMLMMLMIMYTTMLVIQINLAYILIHMFTFTGPDLFIFNVYNRVE